MNKKIGLVLTLLISGLVGCAATQNATNTIQMVDVIATIRNRQVIKNLARVIDDHDAVPSQIVLGVGQSNIAVGWAPTIKATNINRTTAVEVDGGLTDTWTAQWQFTAITDPGDLRKLRNIYALAVSTDAKYNELIKLYGAPDTDERATPRIESEVFKGLFSSDATASPPNSDGGPNSKASPGATGQVVSWESAKKFITEGDSIDCKIYQQGRDPKAVLPFRRWLYWRDKSQKSGDAENWKPVNPVGETVTPLATVGKKELGVTSQACFDDFVILVQALSSTTNQSAGGQAHYMLQ